MNYIYEIPSSFWGLFRSVNRDIYIESLLTIHEEYQYNNYFLSRENCQLVLSEMCAATSLRFEKEEDETLEDVQEAISRRILRWLLHAGWLRKIDDFTTMTTNIVIPDYTAIFLETFEQLVHNPYDETEVYIQNVYATLFSFSHDSRMNLSLLKTALINTRKLNKVLQDMLHNMDKFFNRLLEKKTYGELLSEHLNGYVEEVVKRKYHILKTSDNFYIYKMDIRKCLKEMRENESWIQAVREKQNQQQKEEEPKTPAPLPYWLARRNQEEDVLDLIDQIERGFEDIEHRISNMDKEHSKYIRATVSRLNYLLSDDGDRKGLLVQLLNQLGGQTDKITQDERLLSTAEQMNLMSVQILSEAPLFKRRRKRDFTEVVVPDTIDTELSMDEILTLNKIRHRYSKAQIDAFIEEHLSEGSFDTEHFQIRDESDFELLILAYNQCTQKNSSYEVLSESKIIDQGFFSFPAMSFVKKGKEV